MQSTSISFTSYVCECIMAEPACLLRVRIVFCWWSQVSVPTCPEHPQFQVCCWRHESKTTQSTSQRYATRHGIQGSRTPKQTPNSLLRSFRWEKALICPHQIQPDTLNCSSWKIRIMWTNGWTWMNIVKPCKTIHIGDLRRRNSARALNRRIKRQH